MPAAGVIHLVPRRAHPTWAASLVLKPPTAPKAVNAFLERVVSAPARRANPMRIVLMVKRATRHSVSANVHLRVSAFPTKIAQGGSVVIRRRAAASKVLIAKVIATATASVTATCVRAPTHVLRTTTARVAHAAMVDAVMPHFSAPTTNNVVMTNDV